MMTPVSNWFERSFEFSFPAELHPNLCMRLRGTPARLEEILRECAAELLVRRADRWSIQEHAGHLLDLEPLWMGRVDDFLAGTSQLRPADLSNRKTHEANHNARSITAIMAEFRRERFALVSRVEPLGLQQVSLSILHPRLQKPMRMVDHLYFAAEHDDHHLAKIWELVRQG